MKYLQMIIVCVCLALCMSARAEAHKVNIFAYVDGDTIHTSSGYSKSRRVESGTVEVRDAATGKVLLTGTTDPQGQFSFPVPEQAREGRMDLELVILAGEGHRAVWKMPYTEYNPSSNVENSPQESVETSVGADSGSADVPTADLERIVRRVVREEVSGVKQMIADMRDEDPGMSEVAAGIGYLLGLAGLVAWFRSRRPRS